MICMCLKQKLQIFYPKFSSIKPFYTNILLNDSFSTETCRSNWLGEPISRVCDKRYYRSGMSFLFEFLCLPVSRYRESAKLTDLPVPVVEVRKAWLKFYIDAGKISIVPLQKTPQKMHDCIEPESELNKCSHFYTGIVSPILTTESSSFKAPNYSDK